jgi:hypothetical protein
MDLKIIVDALTTGGLPIDYESLLQCVLKMF